MYFALAKGRHWDHRTEFCAVLLSGVVDYTLDKGGMVWFLGEKDEQSKEYVF